MTSLYDHYTAIVDQPARRTSQRNQLRGATVQPHVKLTVRPCPVPGHRWVVVLDSDELEIHGFTRRKDADAFYTQLVRDCEDDYARYGEHAWHTTDVPGIPLLPAL